MEAKSWYKSKTIIVGFLSVVIGILTYIQGQIGVGAALTIEGIIMVVLRLVTKEAVKFFGEE